MTQFLSRVHGLVWGAPLLMLILGVGGWLTWALGAPQMRLLPKALREFARRMKGGSSSFQALCTALAATVGTGNLVGVAGAICLGGPGAIFWMWLCGILGMAVKFCEATLAVRYRVATRDGFRGGPMYVLDRGLGSRGLAKGYCLFGTIAAFGVGNMAQVNAVAESIGSVLPLNRSGRLAMGLTLALLTAKLLLGGAGKIGALAERLVPVAAAGYLLLCFGVLAVNFREIPGAFGDIVRGAWEPKAVTGGMLGSAVQALKVGCARGVFTNEAGMGTAGIAHGGAEVDHPVQQGLMGIMEVFLDTIIMCTLTALVILVSGVEIPYGVDAGGSLTGAAFETLYGGAAKPIIAIFLCLFAVATILGWSLYGGRCAQYLFGDGVWKYFALVQSAVVILGAVLKTEVVWQCSEILNGLMAVPNLICLAALWKEARRLTIEYKKSGRETGGGNYANFHQCKPL